MVHRGRVVYAAVIGAPNVCDTYMYRTSEAWGWEININDYTQVNIGCLQTAPWIGDAGAHHMQVQG